MSDCSQGTEVAVVTLPEGLTAVRMAALARELVMNRDEPPIVLARFGLTLAHLDLLVKVPYFKNLYEAMALEWNSPMNTEKRLQLQSLTYLEEALPSVAARMTKSTETLVAVVETGKLFAKLGGIGERGFGGAGSGEKFVISINFGNKRLEREVQPIIEGRAVQPLPEGSSAIPQLQQLPEGPGENETVRGIAERPSKTPERE